MFIGLAFVLAFLSFLVLALARHPIYGVCAYLAVFFVHPPSRWWAQSLPDLRWSLLSAGVTLLAFMIHQKKLEPQKSWASSGIGLLFIAYCLWLWIQMFWAIDFDLHLEATIQYTKYLLAFYFVYRAAGSDEHRTWLLMAYVFGCATLGIMGLYSDNFVDGRLNGVGGPGIDDANSLSMVLGTGTIVGAMLTLSLRGWRRIAVIVSMPFIINGLILGGSRGAFLAVTVGGLVLMVLKPGKYRRVFWLFAIVGIGLAVSLMDKRFIDRMMTIETAVEDVADADLSAQSRVELQKAQFQMFARYPFGSGHKGTALLASQFLDEKWMAHDEFGRNTGMRSSHNTFLTTLVEQGIVGATLYLSIVGWWLLSVFRLWRLRRLGMNSDLVSQGAALAGAIAVVLFAGNFTDYLMAEIQFWLFAMLAALLASSPELRTVSQAPPPSRSVGETQLRGQP